LSNDYDGIVVLSDAVLLARYTCKIKHLIYRSQGGYVFCSVCLTVGWFHFQQSINQSIKSNQ